MEVSPPQKDSARIDAPGKLVRDSVKTDVRRLGPETQAAPPEINSGIILTSVVDKRILYAGIFFDSAISRSSFS